MVSLAAMVRIGTAASALLFSTVAALGTNYEHDAVTTYCWAIPKPTNMTKLTEDDRTPAFSTRAECPMVLTLSLPPVDTIHAFDQVNVTWTVQVDFSGANKINNTQLYYGPDKSGRMAQIVHSNIHSCVFGTGCDPFNDGKQLVDKTVNKIANFTDNKASFSDLLQFPEPGEYSVLAHIILPNFNASSRFDYAVYTKLTVLSATTPPPTPPPTAPIQTTATPIKTSGGSGLSQGATIAIVIGAIVVAVAVIVIVVLLRRRRDNQSSGYSQAPVQEAGYLGGHHSSNLGPMKPSELTDTNSTAGFQSAWGGHHGATGLDNTNQSSASSGSHGHPYSVPRPSDRRPNSEMHRPSDARSGSDVSQFSHPSNMSNEYFARPSSSQNPRKKRVDSDVEL